MDHGALGTLLIGLDAIHRDKNADDRRRQVDRSPRRPRKPALVLRALEGARRVLAPDRLVRRLLVMPRR